MSRSYGGKTTTKAYKGGGMGSRNWGKDENEKGYGTKMSGGIHNGNYTDDKYTKGRNDEDMSLNHRYQKQFMGRYRVRMGNKMTRYQINEKGNMKDEVAGKVKGKTKSGERAKLGNPSGKRKKTKLVVITRRVGKGKEQPLIFTGNSIGYLAEA